MKENKNDKLDNLFKSNSDYLANEPHPDFDPEAFWKVLQPELTQKKTRKVAWWWVAAAVVVLLGGIGWLELTSPEVLQTAGKPGSISPMVARTAPEEVIIPPSPTSPEFVEALTQSDKHVAKATPQVAKAAARHRVVPEVPREPVVPEVKLSTGPEPDRTMQITQTVETSEAPEVMGEATGKPGKPTYRIVHLNELRKPKIQVSQGRARLAFQIGATAETMEPAVPTPTPRFTIPIKPQ